MSATDHSLGTDETLSANADIQYTTEAQLESRRCRRECCDRIVIHHEHATRVCDLSLPSP